MSVNLEDIETSDIYKLAISNWVVSEKPVKKSKKSKKADKNPSEVISEIYQKVLKNDSESVLQILDYLKCLELYLWPNFEVNSTDHHVTLIAILICLKERESEVENIWEIFENGNEKYPIFFNRIVSIIIRGKVGLKVKSQLILFLTNAFNHLDYELVRKQIGRLISIGIWKSISEPAREDVFRDYISVRKVWNGSEKRFKGLNEEDEKKSELIFDRNWLFSVVLDFIDVVMEENDSERELYVLRFLAFLITIVSQLPTRRYVNTLLKDINLIAILKFLYNGKGNKSILDMIELLAFYINFPFDDFYGQSLDEDEVRKRHEKKIKKLQLIAYKKYPQLKVLALSNFSSIQNRVDLQEHLSELSIEELKRLADDVIIRYSYPTDRKISTLFNRKDMLIECFIEKFELKQSIKEYSNELEIYPDESILSSSLLEDDVMYKDILFGKPLPTYKLSLQYLSVEDFLLRSFYLWKLELMHQIRNDLIAVGTRLKPRMVIGGGKKRGRGEGREDDDEEEGDEFVIHQEPKLFLDGFSKMAAKVIDKPVVLSSSPPLVGDEFPSNVTVEVNADLSRLDNEARKEWDSLKSGEVVFLVRFETADGRASDILNRLGIKYIRCGELVRILDEKDRDIHKSENSNGGRRKFHIDIDSKRYVSDDNSLIHGFNVIIRRRTRENNFKPMLDSLKGLLNSKTVIPNWLVDVFLGFGNPSASSSINQLTDWVNLGYTLKDVKHIKEVFPNAKLDGVIDNSQYKLREIDSNVEITNNNSLNNWKKPKTNLRFTPTQAEAIFNSIHKGLTLIVGPPGTGKTDVATQILNILYNNYPNERILVITHSNQALNHIFEKLIDLDIPDHRLLRLGHGEEKLDANSSFSKLGRIEYIIKSRIPLLREVDRLVKIMNVHGEYGDSCETALEFFSAYVKPEWEKYNEELKEGKSVINPFKDFSSAETDPTRTYLDITQLFDKISSIRPYELLSSNKQRSNYLLTHESRVVAMTSTYACMNRQELINLGFKYNSIIIEECAQINEIETFIPLTMQKDNNNLERLILIGDHHQNAPIIQNLLLSNQANLNQSLFSRLIRLGVPTIQLDYQGRARPEIANIYNWIYKDLKNLPHTEEFPKFNPGLFNTYQFINIDDYNGRGESEPSPHFFQNLGEAEYSVALYQYMRLLGYPKEKISILTTYYGQKVLIEEIIKKRCTNDDTNRKIFGHPAIISTVDQYQGEQNDYIILSLVRTKSIGYLRDIRRLTVAFSRAKLGLYILGRKDLLINNPNTEKFINHLISSDNSNQDLLVVPGELYNKPTIASRKPIPMQGLAHLGQYVHEMSQKRYEYENSL